MEAFLFSTLAVAIAEVGDKTQVATLVLAIQFESVLWVTLGTTLGMLIANVPVIFAGGWLLQRLRMEWFHWAAALIFSGMGAWILIDLMIS